MTMTDSTKEIFEKITSGSDISFKIRIENCCIVMLRYMPMNFKTSIYLRNGTKVSHYS